MYSLWDAVQGDLKGNRDLLLDLFCRDTRPLGNNVYVVVRYVGIGLNRQPLERDDPPGEKDQRQRHDKKPVVESEIDDSPNHFIAPRCFAVAKRLRPLDLRA